MLGSEHAAVLAAIGELRGCGALDPVGRPLPTQQWTLVQVHPFTRRVFAEITANHGRPRFRVVTACRHDVRRLRDDLAARGLMTPSPAPAALIAVTTLMLGGLILLFAPYPGTSAITVAAGLAMTIVCFAVTSWVGRRGRRTRLGTAVLRREQLTHAALHPRNLPSLLTYGPTALAYSAALFGPSAIRTLDPGLGTAPYLGGIAGPRRPHHHHSGSDAGCGTADSGWDSGSNCGSSGSSCGSSCGGSGCGGGGGD
ncbi:MAG: TIGR04222 domain-containing membrane protein [Gordonia sp. (in: high G+C Gram-positive bacteria)]